MRALVACERSGRVRSALRAVGVDAWSCDLVAADDSSEHHIVARAETILDHGWDLLIAHPPCTFLANVGWPCFARCVHPSHDDLYRRWRHRELILAAELFHALLAAPVPKVAIENPMPHPRAAQLIGMPTAWTEPHQHGHRWTKRTGWWLRGLQPLSPTAPVHATHRLIGGNRGVRPGIINRGGTPELIALRSETPAGLAAAIAAQWGHPGPQTLF